MTVYEIQVPALSHLMLTTAVTPIVISITEASAFLYLYYIYKLWVLHNVAIAFM